MPCDYNYAFSPQKNFRESSILFCFFSSFFFRSISTNKGKKNDVCCNIPALELKSLKSRSQTVYAFFVLVAGAEGEQREPGGHELTKKVYTF